jgi:hypothetical protein
MCRVIMPQEEQGIKCMPEAELRGMLILRMHSKYSEMLYKGECNLLVHIYEFEFRDRMFSKASRYLRKKSKLKLDFKFMIWCFLKCFPRRVS